MKKAVLMIAVLVLMVLHVSCGEEIDDNGMEEEGENDELLEEMEGMEYVLNYMEQEFPINEREPLPYDGLGATDGIAIRIGEDLVEFYDFSEVGDQELADQAIDDALNTGTVNIEGTVFPAVYNEEHQVMLVDYENHPQGEAIKERFEEL